MVQSRNLASGAGEKLRREHVPAAAGARSGEGQPSGTQGYDDLARLAVVRLGRRCRGIEQSVRSPMKLRSFSCEWRGTSSPFFKYTCAIIIRSPVTRRRVIVPLSDSSGMRSQRWWLTLLKSATPMKVPSSEKLWIDSYVERGDETVGFVYQADDRQQLRILGLRHALVARRGAVGSDTVPAAVRGAYRKVQQLLGQRIERSRTHDFLDVGPDTPEGARVVRDHLPEIVDPVGLAGRHDVVVDL